MTTVSTIAGEVYERIYALAAQFADEASNAPDGVMTMASRGPVPINYAPDIITMGDIIATQDAATLGRGRDEEVNAGVTFSSLRTGDPDDASRVAKNAAFALTNKVAEYVRSTLGDTTLSGTVAWCFLTDITASSIQTTEPAGFLWEVSATFRAMFRIRG